MKKPANFDLRTAAKNAGVPLWAIADALHISEPTMTRKLRRELGETEKKENSRHHLGACKGGSR
ncbi:MAG: hypothetical protein ACLR5X_15545 [Oscillospiraceae bacterium]